MVEQNNLKDITGVIYSKPTRPFTYKKGPKAGQAGESLYIVLEIRGTGRGKDYIDFHKFLVANPSISLDDFAIKDNVVITYALAGREWNGDIINDTKAVYIKHADVDYNDTKDLRAVRPDKKKEDVFIPPNPLDEGEESDLPF